MNILLGSDAISAHSLENNASATELLKEVHEVKEEFKNIVDLVRSVYSQLSLEFDCTTV